ncbi:MAG: trypsin-like peptidase domain-containing protein [Candidatus Omnitrophica bacterium]|nr:trypsin-like peptidase domain-containing protein [Candidatus Omnitrophota bacterium]
MRINRFVSLVVLVSLGVYLGIISPLEAAEGQEQDQPFFKLLPEIKKAVVFLGVLDSSGKPIVNATGFLVRYEEHAYLTTAKHVVYNSETNEFQDEDQVALVNLKSGKVSARAIQELKKRFRIEWIFHEDPAVDLAILPFPINAEQDAVKVVPDRLFLEAASVHELADVFFLSSHPGMIETQPLRPVIRMGGVSLVEGDKTFYIDAASFPGSSGSPVFLKPSPFNFSDRGMTLSTKNIGIECIGIVGEFIHYSEVAVSAQTGRPRVVFEQNTGMSRVWSVEYLQDIFQSKAFKKQHQSLKDKDI